MNLKMLEIIVVKMLEIIVVKILEIIVVQILEIIVKMLEIIVKMLEIIVVKILEIIVKMLEIIVVKILEIIVKMLEIIVVKNHSSQNTRNHSQDARNHNGIKKDIQEKPYKRVRLPDQGMILNYGTQPLPMPKKRVLSKKVKKIVYEDKKNNHVEIIPEAYSAKYSNNDDLDADLNITELDADLYADLNITELDDDDIIDVNIVDKTIMLDPNIIIDDNIINIYTTLRVNNLTKNVTEDNLHELFSPFGSINRITLPLAEDKSTRGFAYIVYDNSINRSLLGKIF